MIKFMFDRRGIGSQMLSWATRPVRELRGKTAFQLGLRLFDCAVVGRIMHRTIQRYDEVIGERLIDRRMIEVSPIVSFEQ